MSGFVDFSIDVDPGVLAQRVLAAIADAFPGWTANEANLEVVLAEELARLEAETRQVVTDATQRFSRMRGIVT